MSATGRRRRCGSKRGARLAGSPDIRAIGCAVALCGLVAACTPEIEDVSSFDRNSPFDPSSPDYRAAPPCPSNVVVVPGYRANRITWGSVEGSTEYRVCWSDDGTEPSPEGRQQMTTTATSWTHDHLYDGTTYLYGVVALQPPRESAVSRAEEGTPGLLAPAGFSCTPLASSVRLTWHDVPGVATYRVYWITGTSGPVPPAGTSVDVSGTTYLHSGLASGVSHRYCVVAVCDGVETPPSPVVAATPL